MIKYTGAIGLALAFACPVMAEDDAQLWLTFVADIKVDNNDSITGTALLRSRPDSLDPGQRLLRIAFTHKINHGRSLSFSYTHVRNFIDTGPDRIEHRLSETFAFPIGGFAGGKIDGRVQSEQNFDNGFSDVGLRMRGRVRWSLPLTRNRYIQLQLSDEPIFAMNNTDYGQKSGLVANRASVGVHFDISKAIGIAPSYTWQLVNRQGRPDRNDHIAGLTIDTHF
jgi:Protein of unknown function (DUF2490)